MNKVGYINDQEGNVYNFIIKDVNKVALKDFQYKLNVKKMVTKSFLHGLRKNKQFMFICKWESEMFFTLSKISNWSPYIFMLVLKVRFGYTKFMLI